MTTVEVLRAAKARIDTPEKWWGTVPSLDGECALIALGCVGWGRSSLDAGHALARAMGVSAAWHIPQFNNVSTHAEVMAAFDRAIANEEARAQEFTATPAPVEGVMA